MRTRSSQILSTILASTFPRVSEAAGYEGFNGPSPSTGSSAPLFVALEPTVEATGVHRVIASERPWRASSRSRTVSPDRGPSGRYAAVARATSPWGSYCLRLHDCLASTTNTDKWPEPLLCPLGLHF